MAIVPVKQPEYLWLFEAFVELRLAGHSEADAIRKLAGLYPRLAVYALVKRACGELVDAMAPVYAQRERDRARTPKRVTSMLGREL